VLRKRIDYAGQLAKLAFGRKRSRGRPREVLPEPKKKHGRKALFGGKVTDMKPHQRHMGSLLKDVAEISTRYPTLGSRGFTKRLLKLPQYKHTDNRTLRRDIAEALASLEDLRTHFLQHDLSREDWLDLLGVEPPTTTSKLALRQKSLELLRKKLKG